MPEKLPTRIFICSECDYRTEYRYVLRNHLRSVHGFGKRDSAMLATQSEYWLSPRYVRADIEELEEIEGEE